MKKILRFLVVAMLFAMTGASFEIAAAKKSCSGRVKSDCTGSCEWRNKKCRHKAKQQSNNVLKPAMTGMDASKVPAGSIIIYNTETSLKNVTFVFYDVNEAPLTAPTTIPSADPILNGKMNFKNRSFVVVPSNAKFMDIVYPGQNQGDLIKICDMLPLDISSDSLPKIIGDAISSDNGTVSISSSNAVIVYDFMLQTQAMPPLPSSGILKLNVALDHNDPSCTISFAFKTKMPDNISEAHHGGVVVSPINMNASFSPDAQFAGSGLVGQAMSDGTAKIYDPSGVNPQVYLFTNVQSGALSFSTPAGLTLIGKKTSTSSPACRNGVCSNAVMTTVINFYGKLQ